MIEILHVVTTDWVPFTIVFVPAGTQSPTRLRARISDQDIVEFYDSRHAFTQYGQFVADYHADSLAKRAASPLSLDTSVPTWFLDAETMRLVTAWIINTIDFRLTMVAHARTIEL